MATTSARKEPQFRPLPESEAEFLRVLRASALAGVDLRAGDALPGLTQANLEQQMAMSRPSILNLVKHFRPVLLDSRSEGERSGTVALDPDAGIAVGVAIGHADVEVAASDLYGRIPPSKTPEGYERRAVGDGEDADATVDWVAGAIERRVAELRRSRDDVVGVGVSIAAPVDRDRGVVRAPLFRAAVGESSDWDLWGVRDHLRRRLGWEQIPFLVDNDANLSALAEYTWGAARAREDREYRNIVYLDWSDGIGAGLILGGDLYRGVGVAGEIGHAVIAGEGSECPNCGNRGCLESFAAWPAVSHELRGVDDVASALELARAGDPVARRAFDAAAEHVARALGPLITVLNPDLVLVGGTVGREGYDVVRPSLLRALKRSTMRPALQDVEVSAATLPGSTAIRGTIALVLRAPKEGPDPLLAYLQRRVRRARNCA